LLAAASAISLLLCLGTVGLWVRSDWREDDLYLDWQLESFGATSNRGVIALGRYHGWSSDTKLGWESREPEGYYPVVRHRFGQFGFGPALTNDPQKTGLIVMIPHWSLLVPLSALLLFRPVLLLRRSRKSSRSACVECSYDLTGNISGVCPECGTPVPKETAEKSLRTG
jgi:hypothetical protein